MPTHDPINHPAHYTSHPSGVECIQIVEHLPFNIGAAIKYLWRAGLKGDAVEDLQKAEWYCRREYERRKRFEKGEPIFGGFYNQPLDAPSQCHCYPWRPVDLEEGQGEG